MCTQAQICLGTACKMGDDLKTIILLRVRKGLSNFKMRKPTRWMFYRLRLIISRSDQAAMNFKQANKAKFSGSLEFRV